MRNFWKSFRYSALFAIPFFLFAGVAQAATLSIAPASGSFAEGRTFTVSVYVSSPSQAVNAFSGDISYPTDKLTFVSLSKTGSIVNFWATEPTVKNGTIHFEGVALNPGYTGSAGKILNLTFRGSTKGVAPVTFLSSSVLANDGLGTSVLDNTNGGLYTVTEAVAVEEQPETGLPSAPVVASTTHKDQNNWYSARVAELSWELPEGVTTVAYITNAKPDDTPTTLQGLATGRSTPALADGVWYTHVRFRNKSGWGPTTHFKTQIDGTAPTNVDVKSDINDEGLATFELSGVDELSGVGAFGITINDGREVLIPVSGVTTRYTAPLLPRGTYTFVVRAYDRAENWVSTTGEFEITRIDPPTITEYQTTLKDEDFLVIRGMTYPDIDVEFSLLRLRPVQESIFSAIVFVDDGAPVKITVRSDSKGNFILAYTDRVSYGIYKISARAVLGENIMSEPSELIVIPVSEDTTQHILRVAMNPITIAVVLLLLFILVLFLFLRTRRRYRELQMRTAPLIRESIENITPPRPPVPPVA